VNQVVINKTFLTIESGVFFTKKNYLRYFGRN